MGRERSSVKISAWAWSHRQLWSVNCVTELMLPRGKGISLLFSMWENELQTFAVGCSWVEIWDTNFWPNGWGQMSSLRKESNCEMLAVNSHSGWGKHALASKGNLDRHQEHCQGLNVYGPPKFIFLNLNIQSDGIRKLGPWEVIRSRGQSTHEWD